ncbi:hypothetical protein [Streptomyces sp. NPDC005780]|uniref:hypothetical protein n=1 Tax=Streptomyces sp. NPDC005780 TaxID=3364730 RepID=UPI0036C090D1
MSIAIADAGIGVLAARLSLHEAGHRDVRVFERVADVRPLVSSGAHPRYARNPGTGETAVTATVTVHAEQEISHGTARPSRTDLPVWAP